MFECWRDYVINHLFTVTAPSFQAETKLGKFDNTISQMATKNSRLYKIVSLDIM